MLQLCKVHYSEVSNTKMPITLSDIATYLDAYLDVSRFPDDQNGIYRPSSRPIKRIGLAIELWTGIGTWVRQQQLDALFLHRPWRLDMKMLPDDVGVLAYHLAFDLTLTFGYNPLLATALQMQHPTPFAYKESIPYGMFGDITSTAIDAVATLLGNTFGKAPTIETRYTETIQRIAIVGAMTDTFVREAAMHGVDLYITGQFRHPARKAVQETHMNIAIIGHGVGEQWGIHALSTLLKEQWASLETVIAAPHPLT